MIYSYFMFLLIPLVSWRTFLDLPVQFYLFAVPLLFYIELLTLNIAIHLPVFVFMGLIMKFCWTQWIKHVQKNIFPMVKLLTRRGKTRDQPSNRFEKKRTVSDEWNVNFSVISLGLLCLLILARFKFTQNPIQSTASDGFFFLMIILPSTMYAAYFYDLFCFRMIHYKHCPSMNPMELCLDWVVCILFMVSQRST